MSQICLLRYKKSSENLNPKFEESAWGGGLKIKTIKYLIYLIKKFNNE